MSNIEWVDESEIPAPASTPWGRFYAVLASRPGKWAKFTTRFKSNLSASSSASQARKKYPKLEIRVSGNVIYAAHRGE